MNKITSLLLILSTFSTKVAFAQYQASWLNDNYAGINSVTFNPAAPSTFPLSWDLNLVGAEVFFDNNYAFIENSSLQKLYRQREDLQFEVRPDLEGAVSDLTLTLDFFDGNDKRHFSYQTNIMGPSLLFKIKNHRIGLFSGFHSVMGTQDIPGIFSYYSFNPIDFDETFRVDEFSLASMTWSEFGANYSYELELPSGKLAFGASIKSLQGYEAAFYELESPVDITKLRGDTITGTATSMSFGFTNTVINNADNYQPQVNGTGVGFDIGAVFTNASDGDKKYDYKLGFSLMNIGSIKFDQDAQMHTLTNDDFRKLAWENYKGLQGIDGLDEGIMLLSEELLDDRNSSLTGNEFRMNLPTTLNLSADVSFHKWVYLNAAYVQPLRLGSIQPGVNSNFTLTPRFEHRWWGAYLPLVVNNWDILNVGAAARIGYLTVGTENLGSIFNENSNFRGTEFFMALKFNPFTIKGLNFGGGGKRKGRGRSVKGVKCYNF